MHPANGFSNSSASLARFAVCFVIITILSACASDTGSDAPAATATDSAGIQIVENDAPAWRAGEEWRLAADPALSIGAEEGPPHYAFGYAHSPVRLSDGRIVVADMQTQYMHFYDAAGNWLKSAGGAGEGPGEFEQLYRMRRIDGDSIMALNPVSETSIFSPAGDYVRRFRLDAVPGRGNIWWLGRLSNHTLVAYSLQREGTVARAANDGVHEATYDIPEKPPFYRDSLLFMLFDMQGRLIDSIAEMPGQFLGEQRVYAPSSAHAFRGDVFYHSPGDVIEIRAFRSAASTALTPAQAESQRPLLRLERIIRSVPTRDLVVSDELKEAYFESERARYRRFRAQNPNIIDEAGLNRRLSETQFPPQIPAHGNRMYADALGNLWLQEYTLDPDAAARWLVFDTTGTWLGIVQTPARFTVNEIGADYILGVGRDSLDVQYVRLYRLEKPAAKGR